MPNTQKSIQTIGLSQIKIIEATVQEGKGYISLSQGALKVGGVHQEIKKHLQEVLQTDKTDYYQSAWGIVELREAISDYKKLSKENILVSHGCMGAISAILLTILEPGDEVLLPEPTYPAYKNAIAMASGVHVFTGLTIEKLEESKTEKTRIVLLSNPCNPTGQILSRKEIEELIGWCEENEIYLVIDEAYDEYVFEGEFVSITEYVNKSRFVIGTGSYSKSLSMSGWRVGYMAVPECLSRAMGMTQDALLNCPSVIGQHAVLYALRKPELMRVFHGVVKKNRDLAIELLKPLIEKKIFEVKKPPAGFYLFLKTQEKDAFELCMAILREAKVGLIPGRAFGPSGAPFIRLCYAREGAVIREGIDRIKKFFL